MGCDFSGVVEQVGDNVSKFKVGDKVFGRWRKIHAKKDRKGNQNLGGTLAEYFVEEEDFVALKPDNLTMEEAASTPLVAMTSLQALEKLRLVKGESIVILGGASGTGIFGIQMAKKVFGAHVTTTASSKKKEICEQLGADRVVYF